MSCTSLIINVALSLALAEGAVLPTFVFPEEEDDYFAQNVEQIKTDIARALDKGCLDAWPLEDQTEIAVVFRHDSMVPETSDFYIQYQMEQVAADKAQDASVGFRSLSDHVQYKRKLAGALQVWEWSPHQMDFLKATMPGDIAKKLAYVPLSSSTGASDGCDAVLDEDWCHEDEPADVLFFGSMTESRKRLCNMVDEEMDRLKRGGHAFSHQCVSSTFGEALKCKVCKAKIIYSDHSREGASLEVHRINPLLAQGKAVISAKSADKFLDSLYQGSIELVDSKEIPKAISKLLLDDVRRMKLEWRGYALSQQLQRKAQSVLCQSFRSMATLAAESLDAYDSWKRAGLQDYVPYMAERRMQTSGNCTNTTVNCTVTTPTPTPMIALSKISAGGVAAVVSSVDICLDAATVPAFNAAVAMQASVPAAAVSSNCSSTLVSPPSPTPSPSPSPTPSNSTGGRRLQAGSYFMVSMTYTIELTVYPNESNQTSVNLASVLTAMTASDLQTELVQQFAIANKIFNTTTQGTYLVVTALTAPQSVMVTNVTSNVVVPFLTTTLAPSSGSTTTPSPMPSPIPGATPTPTPTPSALPSPSPTPSTAPTPTPTAPTPSPTPSPTLAPSTTLTPSPTPVPSAPPSPTPSTAAAPTPTSSAPPAPTPTTPTTPSPFPIPTPTPTTSATSPSPSPTPSPSAGPTEPVSNSTAATEEESGSTRMCQVFLASITVILSSLLL